MSDNCLLSCRVEVLPGDTIAKQIENALAYGFDAIALPGRYLDSYIKELRNYLANNSTTITSLSLGFKGSLVSPHKSMRAKCRESLRTLFEMCAELNIHRLNMPPILIMDNPESIRDKGEYKSATEHKDTVLREELIKVAAYAKKHNVVISLEPVNRYESEYMNRVEHAVRIIRELRHSHIGLTIDFFHMQIEELKPVEAIINAGKTIQLVHIAENTRVEPGPGTMDFTPGFRALKKIGYNGPIELECRILSNPAETVLPRSVKYIREAWKNAKND